MTLSQALRRFKQVVAYDLDPIFGQYPQDGSAEEQAAWNLDAVGFLQEALGDLFKEAYLTADSTSLTLTPGQAVYPLSSSAWSRRLIEPFSVTIDGRRLPDEAGTSFGLWSTAELVRRFPTWDGDPPGAVQRAVFRGDRLILHPAPSMAGTATVEGRVGAPVIDPAAMDAALPGPEDLHPHVVGLAVFKACKDHSQTSGQMTRLVSMREEARAKVEEVRLDNLNAQIGTPDRVFPNRIQVMGV